MFGVRAAEKQGTLKMSDSERFMLSGYLHPNWMASTYYTDRDAAGSFT